MLSELNFLSVILPIYASLLLLIRFFYVFVLRNVFYLICLGDYCELLVFDLGDYCALIVFEKPKVYLFLRL